VLRADWTAQTVRITRIPGTDAASPTAPAKASSAGSSYDILLYQALVDTAGTVSLTDERTNAQIQTADIASLAVTSAKLGANAVIAGKINTGGVSAAAQIANDVIDSQHYVDGSIDTAHIGDLQVTSGKLAANAVIAGKIAAGAVEAGDIAAGGVSATNQLADDIVDDAKAGNRVVKLTRRQGGSATNWQSPGATDYTPTGVLMQVGVISSSLTVDVSVTFPIAFSNTPIILIFPFHSTTLIRRAVLVSGNGTGFSFGAYDQNDARVLIQCQWLAIGPE
jgi:hypothetical protein